MPQKNKKLRKEYYNKNKEEINRKRREYRKRNRDKVNAQQAIWRESNRARANELSRISKKRYEERCKKLVFEHYGDKCACCGENNIKFLTIDHINGGGTRHREKIKMKVCIWLVKNNFPNGFQILCYNCNCGKRVNNGVCPHKG